MEPVPVDDCLGMLTAMPVFAHSSSPSYNAAAMGIDIQQLSFELETDTDLRGFMELDPKIRPGLTEMRIKVNLACNGTPQQVKELHEAVLRTSPLMDTFKNPVNVKMKY